jgi:hypothetical protein
MKNLHRSRLTFLAALSGLAFAIPGTLDAAGNARELKQHGITWTFDKAYVTGTFVTGDFWVVGPVRIVGISTDLHADGFTPEPGQDGSMLNPGTNAKQGYDNRLTSYEDDLNAALPGGSPVSPENALVLEPNSSLVSMVSWLYRSPGDTEPGIPKFNGNTKVPRPVTRSGAVLTILKEPAPEGSFRPPYCGADKSIKFNKNNLKLDKLRSLNPAKDAPEVAQLTKDIARPWIDHVNEFLGAMVHPSENMPNYGREMARIIVDVGLVLNMDIPGKEDLVIPFVQMGIDFAGIADNGGAWPANGGHHHGRKLPILVAGVLLDDEHMKGVGKWSTEFQEDQQTFYVTQKEVDLTNGSGWRPDKRGGEPEPYTAADIGMPEWGIRHAAQPENDNKLWTTPYRSVNYAAIPGFALVARMMDQVEAWNHPALFDYADRVMKRDDLETAVNTPSDCLKNAWNNFEATRAK